MSTRILMFCDKVIMCEGMRALLEEHNLQVRAETSVQSIVALATEDPPEVIVVVSPALTVDDRTELAELAQLSKVLMLAKAENMPRAFEALRVGVRAVLSVESSVDELIHVIRTLVEVDAIVVPVAARKSVEMLARSCPLPPAANTLTLRENEVLLLLAQGMANDEIAEKLSVSGATIRSHVHNVLHKLNVRSRAQAVAVAYETGLINTIEQKVSRR
ncbi:response regulator transcription factor [Streptomyces sp. A73]|uniref:MarZ n=1 Tax=Streptomyces sp. CNQ-617 TaxID=483421 RepID=A0A067YNS6_9ACTN|nr:MULTISPECIES: response regulator transcription factor [unclassified Streptomyces]AHF22844.1 MarZ [Streptomyces sp. CNQ-617]MBQ0866105.1 response regulator transcription factor [Streptomyces sp. RK75]MBQ1120140.1 response regulator transcription factor [Streptomyces sp. B15]MBQ1158354.1 response regulator transcription factor [Streptomyces sp. A73]